MLCKINFFRLKKTKSPIKQICTNYISLSQNTTYLLTHEKDCHLGQVFVATKRYKKDPILLLVTPHQLITVSQQ